MTRRLFDRIGSGYTVARRPDPRIAAQILDALGSAETVLDVGAGTGNYEPTDRAVVAVDPSRVMLNQHPGRRRVRAAAERLPFPDRAFDAAMAVNTLTHWSDRAAGLNELRRVARDRIVIVQYLSGECELSWLAAEYFPEHCAAEEARALTRGDIERLLGPVEIQVVLVPYDCADGFVDAYWRRPEAYLDEQVWRSMSPLRMLPDAIRRRGLERLREDLRTGAWRRRHGHLLDRDVLDVGFRLIVARIKP